MNANVIINLQTTNHFPGSFRVSMIPINNHVLSATVYNVQIADEESLHGSTMTYETTRRLTAVKFSNVNQALEYVNKAVSIFQEFKSLLIFQSNGEEAFVLGDYIGWTVDE